MEHSVILQFSNFDQRAEWLKSQRHYATQVYEHNPWVAATIPTEHLEELKTRGDVVQVFPDVKATPA
jgi:hypothetical protein